MQSFRLHFLLFLIHQLKVAGKGVQEDLLVKVLLVEQEVQVEMVAWEVQVAMVQPYQLKVAMVAGEVAGEREVREVTVLKLQLLKAGIYLPVHLQLQ